MKNIMFKNKLSIINSGDGNPMFGKPSPIGSGNGWSGWYKGWYFRSLLELSYMIFVIERFNLKWDNGEKKKYKIEYDINAVKRNYFPDFFIENKYLVECKPRSLWNSEVNKLKFESATKYCSDRNLVFKIINCRTIKRTELIQLYKSGRIRFIEKYEKRILLMIESS